MLSAPTRLGQKTALLDASDASFPRLRCFASPHTLCVSATFMMKSLASSCNNLIGVTCSPHMQQLHNLQRGGWTHVPSRCSVIESSLVYVHHEFVMVSIDFTRSNTWLLFSFHRRTLPCWSPLRNQKMMWRPSAHSSATFAEGLKHQPRWKKSLLVCRHRLTHVMTCVGV